MKLSATLLLLTLFYPSIEAYAGFEWQFSKGEEVALCYMAKGPDAGLSSSNEADSVCRGPFKIEKVESDGLYQLNAEYSEGEPVLLRSQQMGKLVKSAQSSFGDVRTVGQNIDACYDNYCENLKIEKIAKRVQGVADISIFIKFEGYDIWLNDSWLKEQDGQRTLLYRRINSLKR